MTSLWLESLLSAGGTVAALAIAAAVIVPFRTKITERIRREIGHDFDIDLEELKDDIGKRTSQLIQMQSAANAVLIETQKLNAARRLKALDVVWQDIQRIRVHTAVHLFMLDLVGDFPDSNGLSGDYDLRESRSKLLCNQPDVSVFDQERPYIGEKMYALCTVYRELVFLLMSKLEFIAKGALKPNWRQDTFALSLVEKALGRDEMAKVDTSAGVQAMEMTGRVHEAIRENMQRLIVGKQSIEEGVELVAEVHELLAQKRLEGARPSGRSAA